MTKTAGQEDGNFPVFELGYSDNLTGEPKYVRSKQGMLFLRLPSGGAFNWINLRIISSRIPLKLKYECLYKQPGTEKDLTAEASEGQQCPRGECRYIKKLAITSKVYYRCWLTRIRVGRIRARSRRGILVLQCRFCGTEEDNRWITALEVKMPPLVEAWRSA